MYNVYDSFRNVRLVKPDDPDYIAFMRRMADKRPSRGGPRAAGEYLGGMVEQAVRHWLGGYVPLQEERILSWEQRLRNGRHATLYRELDAVWTIDHESLCLYEMKLTTPENMERGVGLRQLDTAAETLFTSKRYRYVLERLVYVAEEPIPVLDGLPALAPDDEYEELGVVWVPPQAVETAAKELGLELPEDWLKPEAREGFVEDPEREEWRQYADTMAREQTEEEPPSGPLADALRRALKQEEP
ncbi:MAG TPA: hypothetical protein VFB38_25165 [Chthonomonadaceae bacterium]|nr:hypothetical protein [Chthonomonadaceae bacterium]